MKVSVPAKIILTGEHAILYNGKALSVAIDKRSTAEFIQREMCLNCNKEFCSWSIHFEGAGEKGICQTATKGHLDLKRVIEICLANEESGLSDDEEREYCRNEHDQTCFAQSGTFSLTCERMTSIDSTSVSKDTENSTFSNAPLSIIPRTAGHIEITIQMAVPFGSGLGSSAVLSVLLAGGIQKVKRGTIDLQVINKLAFKCEQIFHASPSGIDNTTVTYGGCCLFEDKILKQNIPIGLVFLIVNTGIEKSTKKILQESNELCSKESKTIIMNEITKLIPRMQEALGNLKEIAPLIAKNQELLKAYGVSCKEIDNVIVMGKEFGLTGKLTGAGRGGCVIFPFDQQCLEKVREFIHALQNKLHLECFICGVDSKGFVVDSD
jgi:mevalonate kinase